MDIVLDTSIPARKQTIIYMRVRGIDSPSVSTILDFETVLTVWYFETVLTVWYFETVLTVWYFWFFILSLRSLKSILRFKDSPEPESLT